MYVASPYRVVVEHPQVSVAKATSTAIRNPFIFGLVPMESFATPARDRQAAFGHSVAIRIHHGDTELPCRRERDGGRIFTLHIP